MSSDSTLPKGVKVYSHVLIIDGFCIMNEFGTDSELPYWLDFKVKLCDTE